MLTTISLGQGITLRCIRQSRFKQGCLSLQLLRPMAREEAALNALLPAVLLRGTEKSPDLRAITLRLDDLYGASVGAVARRLGDYQTTGLICSFIEDAYALEGDRILAPMADFLRELLLEPVVEGEGFSRDFVEGEKINLISAIDTVRNDKQLYASVQFARLMCREDSLGISRLGERADVEAITPESLYAHYQKILRESPMELFYVGSQTPETVAELLRPLICSLSRQGTAPAFPDTFPRLRASEPGGAYGCDPEPAVHGLHHPHHLPGRPVRRHAAVQHHSGRQYEQQAVHGDSGADVTVL